MILIERRRGVNMNPLRSTLVEALTSVGGAVLALMLNGIKKYSADPASLANLKGNPSELVKLLPGQFEFWLIAFTLAAGAHYSLRHGREKLNQALIALVAFLIGLVFFSFIDGAYTFGPYVSIGLPNLIGVALVFISVHSIVLAKEQAKGGGSDG